MCFFVSAAKLLIPRPCQKQYISYIIYNMFRSGCFRIISFWSVAVLYNRILNIVNVTGVDFDKLP